MQHRSVVLISHANLLSSAHRHKRTEQATGIHPSNMHAEQFLWPDTACRPALRCVWMIVCSEAKSKRRRWWRAGPPLVSRGRAGRLRGAARPCTSSSARLAPSWPLQRTTHCPPPVVTPPREAGGGARPAADRRTSKIRDDTRRRTRRYVTVFPYWTNYKGLFSREIRPPPWRHTGKSFTAIWMGFKIGYFPNIYSDFCTFSCFSLDTEDQIFQ